MPKSLSSLTTAFAVLAILSTATALRATPITIDLNYSSIVGSAITFDGHSHFDFTPTTGADFHITSAGAASGLLGEITGSYTIGTVTTVGSMSSAAVSGTGTLVINDGLGHNLTGSLNWVNIVQFGTGDFLNTSGTVNLSGITYGGSNSELRLLASSPHTASDVLSFQFTPAKSLATLKSTATKTSFSGVISATRMVPDGGVTLLLFGAAFVGLALSRRRFAA